MKVYVINPLNADDGNPLYAKDLHDGLSYCGLEKVGDDPIEVKIFIKEMTEVEYNKLPEHEGW